MKCGIFSGSGKVFVDGKAVGNVTSLSINLGEDMAKEGRRFSKDIEGWGISGHQFKCVLKLLPAGVWRLRALGCCSKGGFTLPRGKMFRNSSRK